MRLGRKSNHRYSLSWLTLSEPVISRPDEKRKVTVERAAELARIIATPIEVNNPESGGENNNARQ